MKSTNKFAALWATALLLAAAAFITIGERIVTEPAHAQGVVVQSPRDQVLRTLAVTPETGYAECVFDSTGTNFFAVSSTNAILQYQLGGTLYTGFTSTNVTISMTNVGAGTTSLRYLKFRNGLLID